MYSDVRLVIWDLDETFWDGTLTEGGIKYIEAHHDIVTDLCARGIMSSICSKNDFEPIKDLLEQKNIWDYFIFPSINWSSKAERVAEIIEATQLRPETVLFVDDNIGNREEVRRAIPGIQIADRPDIASFLNDPGFAGKNDVHLSRLKQYKILERRRTSLAAVSGDNVEFLKQSQIRVEIIDDIEGNIDRAIELINRTNQLNFTKRRLPDDITRARQQLIEEIGVRHARAGLVSVRDRYGDYGICGFFLMHGLNIFGDTKICHLVFSCRCLGMGVEQWVYNLMGRPKIEIAGEVVSDLTTPVDWINMASSEPYSDEVLTSRFKDVRLRGGCELEVLGHYFKAHSNSYLSELVTIIGSYNNPTYSSPVLCRAILGLDEQHLKSLKLLRMDRSVFETKFFDACAEKTLLVYSPSTDAITTIFQHNKNGLELPILPCFSVDIRNKNRTKSEIAEFDRITAIAKQHYRKIATDDYAKYISWYKFIMDNVPENALLVVLLPNYLKNVEGAPELVERQAAYNELFKAAGKGRANVRFIEVTELIEQIDEVLEDYHLHFRRAVYRRIYEKIETIYLEWTGIGAIENKDSNREKPEISVNLNKENPVTSASRNAAA